MFHQSNVLTPHPIHPGASLNKLQHSHSLLPSALCPLSSVIAALAVAALTCVPLHLDSSSPLSTNITVSSANISWMRSHHIQTLSTLRHCRLFKDFSDSDEAINTLPSPSDVLSWRFAFVPGSSGGSIMLVAIMFPEAGSLLSCSFDLWDARCLADLHWSEPGALLQRGVYQRVSPWVVRALTLDLSVPDEVQAFLRTVWRDTRPDPNSYLRAYKQQMDKYKAEGPCPTVFIHTHSVQNTFQCSVVTVSQKETVQTHCSSQCCESILH